MSSTRDRNGDWTWDGAYPHCDQRVLHAPGECHICDKYAGLLQEIRKAWGINFTGHHDLESDNGTPILPCPAEVARPLSIINKWGGNVARTKEQQEELDAKFAEDMSGVLKHFRSKSKGS